MNNKIKLKMLLVILPGIIATSGYSQEKTDSHDHEHDHHKYELGVANSFVYLAKEKEFAYGLHLHFVRKIDHSKFGYGMAYERIFDDHNHNFFGIVGSYNPINPLHLNLTPGVTFKGKESPKLAFHLESSYDFSINDFHFGPLIEIAVDPEDYHIGFGLHIGYGF